MDQVYVKLIFWISSRTKVASNQSNIRSSEADEFPVRVVRSKLIHTNLINLRQASTSTFSRTSSALVRLPHEKFRRFALV